MAASLRIAATGLATICAGLSLSGRSASAAETCIGTLSQRHSVGNYLFWTDSRVEPVPGSAYPRYVTCVYNPDPKNDIRVKWFVPGPYDTWVLASAKEEAVRRRRKSGAAPADGCIQYGNLGEKTVAQFYASPDDFTADVVEREKECMNAVKGQHNFEKASDDADIHLLETLADDFEVFFPSDLKNPRDSMLRARGSAGVKTFGDQSGYKSYVSIFVSKVEGRDAGDLSGISVVPHFTGAAERLTKQYLKENEKPVELREKTFVDFDVAGSEKWSLTSASYQIVDRDHNVLSAIMVPVFVPVEK